MVSRIAAAGIVSLLAIIPPGPGHQSANGSTEFAQTPPATPWGLRICSSAASFLTLQAGANHQNNDVFATWHPADGSKLFLLPAKYQGLPQIYVQVSMPTNQRAQTEMCVKYNDNPRKRMDFNNGENQTVSANDSEDSCKC